MVSFLAASQIITDNYLLITDIYPGNLFSGTPSLSFFLRLRFGVNFSQLTQFLLNYR